MFIENVGVSDILFAFQLCIKAFTTWTKSEYEKYQMSNSSTLYSTKLWIMRPFWFALCTHRYNNTFVMIPYKHIILFFIHIITLSYFWFISAYHPKYLYKRTDLIFIHIITISYFWFISTYHPNHLYKRTDLFFIHIIVLFKFHPY